MKKHSIHNVFTVLFFSTLLVMLVPSIAAEATINSIELDPTDPAPLATITFTADITTDMDPSEVRLVVAECTSNICYKDDFNVSMTAGSGNEYTGEVTLSHDDTEYIKYHVEVLEDGIWYKNEITEFDLTPDPGNGDPNGGNGDNGDTNGGNNDNNTPGFELVAFLIAGVIVSILLQRKR